MDISADLMVDSHSMFRGSFHRGFFNRASKFMDLPAFLNPLADLIGRGKRIIFCGHSLGGAVAHTVLLRFWLENDVLPNEMQATCPDSLISIAFGAPHICDASIADAVNENANLKWRFINFVNQSDPVPRLLHDLRSTVAAGLRAYLGEADNIFKSFGGFSGDCIRGYAEGGYMGVIGAATTGTARRASAAIGSQGRKLGHLVLGGKSASSARNPKGPDFHAVGRYVYLHVDEGTGNQLVPDQFYGSDHRMWEYLENGVELSMVDLEHHKTASYRKVLLASALISGHGHPASSATPHQSQRTDLNVTTPAPKVTFAKWVVNEALTERSIIVRGENLLFLSERVTVIEKNGQRFWRLRLQSDNEVRISDPHATDPLQNSIDSDFSPLSMIVIVTAFGRTVCNSIHKSYSDKKTGVGVPEMIAKLVQTYVMKATPPFRHDDQARQLILELDNILLCAPTLRHGYGRATHSLSQNFKKLMEYSSNNGNGEIENITQEINAMVGILLKYLSSMFAVKYISQNSKNLLNAIGVTAIGASVVLAPPQLVVANAILGISSIGLSKWFDTQQTIDYTKVLKAAICETSAWSGRIENNVDMELNGIDEARVLEEILHGQVTKGCSEFEALVKEAHVADASQSLPDFKSKLFQIATSETKLSLLRRIKVVHGVSSLYKAEVEKTHILGVFGAEDAGKSTFIKKVLERYNRDSSTPETGVDTHTIAVQPYKVNRSFWMVDYPGSDTVENYADNWEQFTALPSSSILLLDYEGDVKAEYVQLYKNMKEKLGFYAQVTVVINKVDEEFSGTEPSERSETFTKEYFEDLTTRTEGKLGCAGHDKVYLACVQPAVLEDFNELKSMGILGFEDLVTKFISPYL